MNRLLYVRFCFWLGAVADFLAAVPLLFPSLGRSMFGLPPAAIGGDYKFISYLAASLMLGWAALLAWGSFQPVQRRGLLLLTVVPVVMGLAADTVFAVASGTVAAVSMWPLWLFYALLIPAYLLAFFLASRLAE